MNLKDRRILAKIALKHKNTRIGKQLAILCIKAEKKKLESKEDVLDVLEEWLNTGMWGNLDEGKIEEGEVSGLNTTVGNLGDASSVSKEDVKSAIEEAEADIKDVIYSAYTMEDNEDVNKIQIGVKKK